MLVDAGSDEEHVGALEAYLMTFFQRRTDLKHPGRGADPPTTIDELSARRIPCWQTEVDGGAR